MASSNNPRTLLDLPEGIIDVILCRLPIADAVRTCVLSRSWRRRWQSIPDLDLSLTPNRIATLILFLHSGNIRRLTAASENHDDLTIYNSLAALSARTAASSTLRTFILYNSRCHLHSIACYLPRLNHLQLLSSAQYLDPHLSYGGFKSLRTLRLQSVVFVAGHLITLFSACPLLETASLISVSFEERQYLDDVVAPNLQLLELTGLSYVDEESPFEIDGDCFSGLKNLRTLHLADVIYLGHLSELFSVCPLLEAATLGEIGLEEWQRLNVVAPNLNHLKLGGSQYLDQDFSGFKSLQTLCLEFVKFSGHLSKLFSACPFLETVSLRNLCLGEEQEQCLEIVAPNLQLLELTGWDGIVVFSINIDGDFSGLKNLRFLHLGKVIFRSHISTLFSACPLLEVATLRKFRLEETQLVDIVAPKLRVLDITVIGHLNEFSITSAPLLEIFSLFFISDENLEGTSGDCKVMKVLGGMPNVKKLRLDNCTLKYLANGDIPAMLPNNFDHLKFMYLEVNLGCVSQTLLALCLLRSCSNLQELEYTGSSDAGEVVGVGQNFWDAQDHQGVFNTLEQVKATYINGVQAELDFIRFILARAQSLKTMKVYSHNFNKELLMSKISAFPVISNQAQILYM